MLKLIEVGVWSLWLVIATWIQLVRAIVNLHVNMCLRFILWTVNITTLPVRALGALQREKMMERLLEETRSELENLAWDNKKLEAHLQLAIKEHHLMESLLTEIEDEHDKAIVKIELLEREVQLLKDDNTRLREVQTKGLWDPIGKGDTGEEQTTSTRDRYLLEALMIHKNSRGANEKKATTGLNPSTLVDPLTPLVFSSNIDPNAALDQRRDVAFSQSLFSALLSLLVGLIIYEAQDPCMPLVMALFTVVGLSLRSVVQFFSTIKNRPASDAVALLSVNWFILGTLTYPTLPRVACILSPIIGSFIERMLSYANF